MTRWFLLIPPGGKGQMLVMGPDTSRYDGTLTLDSDNYGRRVPRHNALSTLSETERTRVMDHYVATFPSFATMNDYLTFWFRTALVVWVEWPFERVVVWNYLVHFFNATREVCGKSNVFAALLPLLANRGTRARALSWKYSPIPLYISNLQSYSYFDVATYLLIRRSLPSNFFFILSRYIIMMWFTLNTKNLLKITFFEK